MVNSSDKNILVFAEAVTLAHVARCVTVANLLAERNYRVTLAMDNRFSELLGDINFPVIPLNSVSCAYFAKKLAQGLPLYSSKILTDYVNEDLQVIQQVEPDFVIGDFRLSLAISTRLLNVPYATITNAYWSPYAVIDYPIPELPLTKVCGVGLAQKLFDWVRPMVFRLHAMAFNVTCKRFGVPSLPYDLREIYTHADFTLYADIQALFIMRDLPKNHIFIGPILWSAKVSLPDWWDSLPINKPVVFVSLGSSGDNRLLPMIIETLAQMPITTICVTAKSAVIEQVYSNVFVAEFLPADLSVRRADVVICNGGSPMVYQTLFENKAVIGIPSNLDQYLMMSALVKAGKGKMLRTGQVNQKSLRSAIEQSLAEMKFREEITYERTDVDRLAALIESATG